MGVRQGNELLAGLERVAGLSWPVYGRNLLRILWVFGRGMSNWPV